MSREYCQNGLRSGVDSSIGSRCGVGHSIALAQAWGLDPQLFLDAIDGGQPDSPYGHVKGAAMLSGDFDPQFELDGLRKDLALIAADAHTAGVPTDRPGFGIVPAVQQALDRARLRLDEMAVIELNEAFAGQILACCAALRLEPGRVCPQGGALALGILRLLHPTPSPLEATHE